MPKTTIMQASTRSPISVQKPQIYIQFRIKCALPLRRLPSQSNYPVPIDTLPSAHALSHRQRAMTSKNNNIKKQDPQLGPREERSCFRCGSASTATFLQFVIYASDRKRCTDMESDYVFDRTFLYNFSPFGSEIVLYVIFLQCIFGSSKKHQFYAVFLPVHK